MLRVLVLLCGLFVAMAHGADPPAPILIGVSGPFTGGSSPMGLSMREGIRLAARDINARGGVLGRPLQLVERDDEALNEQGVRIAEEFSRMHVSAVVGIVNTGVALASQRLYQEAHIPMLTAVATGSLVTRQFSPPQYPDNFIFRVSVPDTVQAEMIVEEAVEKRGFRRIAILHDATNYGQLGRADLERALERKGLSPVRVERFNIRDVDMTPQLRRAREAGAEVVLTYGIGPELAQIANGMARLGWRAPLVGSWTLAMSNFIDHAGPNAEGARMPQTFMADEGIPHVKAFITAYRNSSGSERIPVPPAAAQGHDALLLLAAAMRQAGSIEGDRVREALENLGERVQGAIMTYDRPFTKSDHESIKSTRTPYMGEVKNGQVVFAYEADRNRAAAR